LTKPDPDDLPSFLEAVLEDADAVLAAARGAPEGLGGLIETDAAAVDFLRSLDPDALRAHEASLHERLVEGLRAVPGVTLVGDHPGRAPLQSFVVDGVHPHDLATILDTRGVAVRAGHHCCQPLMDRFGLGATLRASIACYNTPDEIDACVRAVRDAAEMMR